MRIGREPFEIAGPRSLSWLQTLDRVEGRDPFAPPLRVRFGKVGMDAVVHGLPREQTELQAN